MMTSPYFEMTNDIELRVTPMFLSEFSAPEQREYAFVYKVELQNNYDDDIQLLSKQIIIRDGNKEQYTLEFEDVNDEQACIPAGEMYDYTTYCPLETPTGSLRGSMTVMSLSSNEVFEVNIPLVFFRTELKIDAITEPQEFIPLALSV
ncbi:ApaG domain [Halobacteriovorax sp. HLS]|uniref:ApaG domain-containing protein n=1 Tax=Halobacteriovorax sp. HLS TaxID=2234000 RepID=UPI000FDABFE0|nr:ApaG domain [Halobacteriovorax sp. HLS]